MNRFAIALKSSVGSRHGLAIGARSLSLTSAKLASVTLVGAAGGIGQPLALLLKHNPLITQLSLVDVQPTQGLCMDLSHIDTPTRVWYPSVSLMSHNPYECDLVVITAGVPRRPGMSRDDLFKTNADIVASVIEKISTTAAPPKVAIITNPVNSILPFAFKMLEATYGRSKILSRVFGVTTLDCVRASTFYADYLGKDPREVIVPVVGGHSEKTICPLFSLSNFPLTDVRETKPLIEEVRKAGTNVVNAKEGGGSATLGMAYAGSRFVNSVLEAHYGKNVSECMFVYSPVHTEFDFFAEIATMGREGIYEMASLDRITVSERAMLNEIADDLRADIQKGVDYANEVVPPGEQKPQAHLGEQ